MAKQLPKRIVAKRMAKQMTGPKEGKGVNAHGSFESYKGLTVFVDIVWVLILFVVYDYLLRLEQTGCECSKDWRRTFISWYISLVIALTLFKLGVTIFKGADVYFRFIPLIFLSITFMVISLQYVHRLQKEKCECSVGAGRDVLQIVSFYYMFMWLFSFILFITATLSLASMRQ